MKKTGDIYGKRALSISEAAEYACVGRSTVENWLSRGLLPYEELPGRGGKNRLRRIRRDDLDCFLDMSYRAVRRKTHKDDGEIILLPRGT